MTTQTNLLDQTTMDIIKATVPVLAEHGESITKRFYAMMLEAHPELKNVFNQTNQRRGDQPKALANTVYAAAANIDRLEEILPHVKQIAHKHTSLNIKPEQYPIVGKYLLLAIKDVLGDAATDDIIEAWGKAYGVIADVFIAVEKEMYDETAHTPGGWLGFRDFTVEKKVVESDVITSFYLKPTDGQPIQAYEPGQYITVKAKIAGEPYEHLRQYSLSTSPGKDYYRISVKREDALDNLPAGVVSSFLHSSVEEGHTLPITAPSGDFTLQKEQKPLVLISGGVGLTPLISMLETTIKEQPERDVIFIHAAKSSQHHAMREHVESLSSKSNHVTHYFVYDDPQDPIACDKHGRIDDAWLESILPTTDAAFYFCGPKGFMRSMYMALKKLQVSDESIHYEIFGPAEDITA
ncbi:NO-inducible flavohemoprotein [Oceanobacillus kapialis]|uniref:Flavohemoprotein n=1 Tax=Oceanobacillus kapialis TaxID=481353 RepID=A0ABW5Q391_9BACI